MRKSLLFVLALTFQTLHAHAQECVPQCRTGYRCVAGTCEKACEPACAANEICSPDARCVSACNPVCAENEVCTPDARCVSACNPPCNAGETCTAQAQCVGSAPAAAPAPAVAPAPEPVAAPLAAPVAPAPADGGGSGVYTHDGFYFNIGLGFGLLNASAEPSEGTLADETIDVSGAGVLTQLAFGGTVAPGLVIGGGIYGATIPTPEYSASVGGTSVDDEGEAGSMSQIGPFIAYYFSPEGGGHLFAAPVLSIVSGGEAKTYPDVIEENSGTGAGLVLGGGYEFWVGEQWGIGVIGRLQYASATLEDDDESETDFSGTVIGALVTATLH